jgi:hypothetical protein
MLMLVSHSVIAGTLCWNCHFDALAETYGVGVWIVVILYVLC